MNLEIPEIQLSMRDVMQIYQRGGRITRSTRPPNSRSHEAKSKQRHKNLLQYLGQPCLLKYLQNTSVNYKQTICNEYYMNKKLKRLTKSHLPQICLYYQKNQISQQISYRLRFVKLHGKKSKANEYIFQELNRITLPKSLSVQSDEGVLTASQSLILLLINFQEFQKIFETILHDLKKSYKSIKIDQLSRISQERQIANSSAINSGQRQLIDQNQGSLQIQQNQFLQCQIKPQQQKKPQNIRPLTEEIFQSINRQINQLDRALFKRLCLQNMKGVLWPCVVLQPLVGEKDELEVMIYRKFDQASKDQYRSSKNQYKYDEKVLYLAFEEYLEEMSNQNLQKTIQKQKSFNYFGQKTITKINNTFEKLQTLRQSKVFVNLLGTHETKIVYQNFIKMQDLQYEQLQQIIMKTPLRGLVDNLNEYIECLNKHKKLQNAATDGKNSLFRLCKYENENNITQICIPLRSQVSKDDKKVLVRFLKDQGPINQDQTQLLQWISYEKLFVNYAFPKHNDSQKKFYYILGNNISVQQGINYIYSDYYYKTSSFNQVLRLCYPIYDLRRVKIKQQRCINCYYQIQNLQYFRCKFCLRFSHQQCTIFKSKPQSQAQTSSIPIDIHQTQNDEQIWNCSECSPCIECQMPVKSNSIQCFSCKNVYHPICGKLRGLSDQSFEQDKYTCQNCLKCRICNNKLKFQQYCIRQKNIFCVKCFKDYTNNEYCALCMKQLNNANVQWVQCDQRPCQKWVHISCDIIFKQKKSDEVSKLNYSCPGCRKLQKRKIFRNVIQQLKYFDEYQYFYEPDYEQIIGYKQQIKNPICINQMRQKSVQGAYDINSYELIKNDLQLLVKNATQFNMPKDEAHYRARILLVVGSKYLQFFKDIIQCNQQYLVYHNLQQIFSKKRKQFYNDLYQHYLEYLLNFKQQKGGIVQIKKINSTICQQQFFSSKIILNKIFSNSQFIFKVKQKPHKIQNLFTIPRLAIAAWWPIRLRLCYYHPDQLNPIIFQCKVCWETYCCTKRCFNHVVCTVCGQKGCGCDSYLCYCPPMKQKEKKANQIKIQSTLSQSKLQKREYTEYYQYCLKCVSDNLKTNWCYICLGFCYYAYQKCIECGKYYHLNCESKNKWQQMSIFFDSKKTYKDSYRNVRLDKTCYNCSYSYKNNLLIKQKLMIQINKTAIKINLINKYLPIFNYIYELNGIRLSSHQIINLLSNNYQLFLQKQDYLNQFYINFSIIIESMGNNRIARQQFKQYFLNQINRKVNGLNQHQRVISILETKQVKQLKQSKKFFKIYSKWFNHFYYPQYFFNNYQIKFHLEHLTSKIAHHSGLNIGLTQLYQYIVTQNHHMFSANFREQNHLNSRNFERLKIESITTHVSPKSKKNVYFTNKLQKYRLHLIFYNHYKNYKANKLAILREKPVQFYAKKFIELPDFEKITKQYQKYFRVHSDYQSLTDCIFKQQSSRMLLASQFHQQYFNPFQEGAGFVKYNKLTAFRQYQNMYINNKSEMLYRYLSHFALKIYQQNKVVLKKGNTSILSQSKKCWRILKRIKNANVQIKLEKRQYGWVLLIGQQAGIVKSIQDIIKRLKKICSTILTFEDLTDFLGFGMADSAFYQPNHFTHLMQTLPLDSLNRKNRKRQVLKVYDRYNWQRQGNFTLNSTVDNIPTKYEYNVTKKELFYLKKRNLPDSDQKKKAPLDSDQNIAQSKVIPYITFDDIKKDLQDAHSVVKQRQNFSGKEPTFDVYIAPSKIDRLGLFIRNYTKKYTVVTEYIGEVISQAMADVRQKKFHYGCYMFSLGKNNSRLQIIDATFIGNMARYLNHSCDPNCKAKIQNINGQPRILIYTIKDVKQNEELTYDYQFKTDSKDKLICKCKSKNCQGRLT